jgi:hypothetical protein
MFLCVSAFAGACQGRLPWVPVLARHCRIGVVSLIWSVLLAFLVVTRLTIAAAVAVVAATSAAAAAVGAAPGARVAPPRAHATAGM